jgi:hypothetical protein
MSQCIIGAVTSHTIEYIQQWCNPRPPGASEVEEERDTGKVDAAVMLIASGRGAVRAFTCRHTLRLVHFRWSSDAMASALLLRAFSLVERGELRELRVGDPRVFDLIVNTIEQDGEASEFDAALDPHHNESDAEIASAGALLARALESLSVVASDLKQDSDSAFKFIARYKDTVTEIDCVNRSDYGNQVVRSCKRLELLTHANRYDANAWLGLSQLHTLRHVNLCIVSCAAIAAALPRLHTLDAFCHESASVVGFFEDLLPRLRSLQISGTWPQAAATTAPPRDLPLLRELVLECPIVDPLVARKFVGAQPELLHAPYASVIAVCLSAAITTTTTANAENGSSTTVGLLSNVRNLALLGSIEGPFDAARVLRAAPQLRTFTAVRIEGDFLLAASPEGFAGLVHPWLRSIDVGVWRNMPADCVMRLRQL